MHEAMREIMTRCIAAGGTITGEHGVGLDKLPYMEALFTADTLDAMCGLRDVFDPERRVEPREGRAGARLSRSGTAAASVRGARKRDLMTSATVHRPTSAVEVSAIIRECAAAGVAGGMSDAALRLRGGGHWMDAGHAVQAPIRSSLEALRGIVAYTPGDLTITVGAATTLAELDSATRAHGQWCPLLPWGDDAGTVGATVATATAGPFADALGRPRDLVLGVEAVDGTGRIIVAGGRVVKNVAGFDLTRAFTGSWGTLAAITHVHLRLRARPAIDESVERRR